MQFQSFQPFNRYAPFMPWWHHTLRHCGALGMGSLTCYCGRGLGNGRVWSVRYKRVTRVELKAREDNLRALAL